MKPRFHYRPESNWINDPNGLCQVGGVYHLFYQYNPHGPLWGDIHWGHAVSRDLVRWETLPIALTPDAARGELHCFSGCCCVDREGRPRIVYTSVGSEADGRDCVHGAQQWQAMPLDGELRRWQQTDRFALTDAIHGGMHVRDWRDPCVMRRGDGYLMALGGCVEERGCVLLYASHDLESWRFLHVLARSDKADGVPWECPNLFDLDGRTVLFYSPCSEVMAVVGDLDGELRFHPETRAVLDPGAWQGYYAPQAFRDESGRTILFGWMPECDGEEAARRRGWSGVMSLPRVLRVEDGRLLAEPVPEVDTLADWRSVALDAGGGCISENARHAMVRFACQVTGPVTLRLLASPGGEEETRLVITPDGTAALERDRSSLRDEPVKTTVTRPVRLAEGRAEVFVAVDGTIVEACVNGEWLSARVYPTRADSTGLWLDLGCATQIRLGLVGE